MGTREVLPEEAAQRIQQKLQAAVYGTTVKKFFDRYDRDKSGTLEATEFTRAV